MTADDREADELVELEHMAPEPDPVECLGCGERTVDPQRVCPDCHLEARGGREVRR
jgi:uncharacterized OB-fold protein